MHAGTTCMYTDVNVVVDAIVFISVSWLRVMLNLLLCFTDNYSSCAELLLWFAPKTHLNKSFFNQNMEIEDSSIDYGHGSENNELHDSDYGPIEDEPSNSVHKEDELNSENCFHEGDAQCEDSHVVAEADLKEDLVDDNSDMETEDLISIPTSRDSGRGGIEDTEIHSPGPRPSEYVSQPSKSADRELVLNCENLNDNGSDILYENDNSIREGALNNNLVDLPSLMQRSVELTETVTVAGELNSISSTVHAKNGCLAVRDESPVVSHKMDGSCILVSNLIYEGFSSIVFSPSKLKTKTSDFSSAIIFLKELNS